MRAHSIQIDELLTPAEVAAILFVDPKTVTRWARAGKLDAIRTPGGHRRYLKSDVIAIMTGVHHSQKRDAGAPTTPPTAQRETDGNDVGQGVVSEAVAAMESEAWDAAEAVVRSAAAVAAAAEKAAAASSRHSEARAFAAALAALEVAGQTVRTAAEEQMGSTTQAAQAPAAAAPIPVQRQNDTQAT